MTIQTCMAGRELPTRQLIEKILTGRGHQVGEAPNPVRCVDWYVDKSGRNCNLMVVEYTGPETFEMIDVLIDRKHIQAENIAVFSPNNTRGAQDARDYGCLLLQHPFRMEECVAWAYSCEKRCRLKTQKAS